MALATEALPIVLPGNERSSGFGGGNGGGDGSGGGPNGALLLPVSASGPRSVFRLFRGCKYRK